MPFPFEERLQNAVARAPEMLNSRNFTGPRLLLGREIAVEDEAERATGPEAEMVAQMQAQSGRGRIDIAFVEADGLPTVVEAKLYSNTTMSDVLGQALGYARAMFSTPEKAGWALYRSLDRLAARYPDSKGIGHMVRTSLPGWTADELRNALFDNLKNGRCRVVIAADAVPPKVVHVAVALRRSLGNSISLELFNVANDANGSLSAHAIDGDPEAYERTFEPPPCADITWEAVERRAVAATAFIEKKVKDRFYATAKYREYRIERIRVLPSTLLYDATPGLAPSGDLHQVERARREGCSPVMPNLKQLAETGNPYPRDRWDRTVLTNDSYRPMVDIAFQTWERLKAHGDVIELLCDEKKAVQHEIAEAAKVDLERMSANLRWVALNAPLDALRDCALFGLVTHLRRRHGEHRFERLPLPPEFVTFG